MDCWVYQEILYDTQPELVVELVIADGGNLLFMADIFRPHEPHYQCDMQRREW
jgi:cephalosporin hydroxylase